MPLDFNNIQAQPLNMQMETQPGFWASMMQNLRSAWSDPNVRTAFAQTGANLMRSPGYGQSGWDVGANALGVGLNTLEQLRARDRAEALAAQERQDKLTQQTTQNKLMERQVATGERNAATSEANVKGDQEAKSKELARAERALDEAIRHNKSQEEIDRLRADADRIRATTYAGSTGRTPAEIEKLNRLKKYAIEKLGLDDVAADKYAFDYLQTSKGKSPRQLVMEAYQKKAQVWQEQQYDPTAQPTPEMRDEWKKQAIAEVKFAEEAGADVSDSRGVIVRPPAATPPTATPPATAPTAAPGQAPAAPAGAPNPLTQRSIEVWKARGATPEQIKTLIHLGGENPTIYGY